MVLVRAFRILTSCHQSARPKLHVAMGVVMRCCFVLIAPAIIPLALFVALLLDAPAVVTLPSAADDFIGSSTEHSSTGGEPSGSEAGIDSITAPRMGAGRMFDRIAFAYDSTNRYMSLGLDKTWRRALVQDCMNLQQDDHVLDLATGTADVGLLTGFQLRELKEGAQIAEPVVTGVDPSVEMLRRGISKVHESGLNDIVRLVRGDAQDLSKVSSVDAQGTLTPGSGVMSQSVDKISMAFGIRNVPDRQRALREMHRVLKPKSSSRACILEFSLPTGETVLSRIARVFVTYAVPFIGKLATLGSGTDEYQYLQKSILDFPEPLDFAASMAREGLPVYSITSFGYGSVHLYAAALAGIGVATEAEE